MEFSGDQIRRLRQRLGWSVSEMARRLACSNERIFGWERGEATPDLDSRQHLLRLHTYVQSHSESVSRDPLADLLMSENEWDQVTSDTLMGHLSEESDC